MSFILDALRKSEKKRPEGTVPDLQSDHLSPGSLPSRRNLLPFLLLMALLFNAGLLLWWLAPWKSQPDQKIVLAPEALSEKVELKASPQNEESNVVVILKDSGEESQSDHLEVRQLPAPAVEESESTVGQSVIVQNEPQSEQAVSLSVVAPSRETPEVKFVADAAAPTVPATPDEPASLPKASASQFEQAAPAPEPVLAMADLPSSVKSGLPPFDFSLHYFTADPNQRMIRINGMILREGQQLTDGLKLDEITADGAVFAFRDLRFEVVRY